MSFYTHSNKKKNCFRPWYAKIANKATHLLGQFRWSVSAGWGPRGSALDLRRIITFSDVMCKVEGLKWDCRVLLLHLKDTVGLNYCMKLRKSETYHTSALLDAKCKVKGGVSNLRYTSDLQKVSAPVHFIYLCFLSLIFFFFLLYLNFFFFKWGEFLNVIV